MKTRQQKYDESLDKKGLFKFFAIIPKKYEKIMREKSEALRNEHLNLIKGKDDV